MTRKEKWISFMTEHEEEITSVLMDAACMFTIFKKRDVIERAADVMAGAARLLNEFAVEYPPTTQELRETHRLYHPRG